MGSYHDWDKERLIDRINELEERLAKIREMLVARNRGTTHWDGCEAFHHDCALLAEIDAGSD